MKLKPIDYEFDAIITIRIALLTLILLIAELTGNLHAQGNNRGNNFQVIEDFQQDTVGRLPADWYNRSGERKPINYPEAEKESYRYRIRQVGSNKFLHYEGTSAKHINYPLKNKEWVDIHETPYLSWKWRVHYLPDGANENVDSKNDAAASVYVVFDVIKLVKIPKVIRYTWSSTLPEGEIIKKNMGYQKIIVMKSGKEGLGKWHSFERNIVEDYEKYFGETPDKKPLAILILSDGDSTGNKAMADYDDFILSANPRISVDNDK